MKTQKGSVLIVAMLMLLLVLIIMPAMFMLSTQDVKMSTKERRSTVAFQMAEAGLDKAVWKLQESDEVWNQASTGTVISGYNFDALYASTDSKLSIEGQYTIQIASIPNSANAVRVRSVGRDQSTNEARAIEAAYTKAAINAGLAVHGALQWKPNLIVHWGPVICYTNITQQPGAYYPRKITKGYITGYDTDPNLPNGHDFYSTWPDPAAYDYNTYQTKLGNPPVIDLDSYKTLAKNSSIPALKKPSGNPAANSSPAGSGYYTEDTDISCGAGGNGNIVNINCSTCVIYVDGNCEMKDAASQLNLRAVICTGNFDMNADNVADYPARIPVGAKTEYNHPSALPTWTASFSAAGEGNPYTITDEVRIHGYVYVGGTANSGGGNPAIYGILDVQGNVSVNNTILYYDSAVSTGVLALGLKPSIQYWREINPNEISGLP